MVDEPENLTHHILREMREESRERAEKSDALIARIHSDASRNIGKMHADILSMHTDVVEGKAVTREVAVRLTLIEKRTSDIEAKLDRMGADIDAIKHHVGLIKA